VNANRLNHPADHEAVNLRARQSIVETANWCIKAREELGEDTVVLGIDYHHRPFGA